jgi:hypothetical protein
MLPSAHSFIGRDGHCPGMHRVRSFRFVSLLALAAALVGCSDPNPAVDSGVDAGARGLVRWGSRACEAPFEGTMPPPGACSAPSQHTSNTAVNAAANPEVFSCVTRVNAAERSVVVGFSARETHDPAVWPGSLELRGAMGAMATSPTVVGQTVSECEVRLTDRGHVATGRCGQECTVTILEYIEETGSLHGLIRCGAMADDSTPPVYRTLGNPDGVPLMGADFIVNGCQPAP